MPNDISRGVPGCANRVRSSASGSAHTPGSRLAAAVDRSRSCPAAIVSAPIVIGSVGSARIAEMLGS